MYIVKVAIIFSVYIQIGYFMNVSGNHIEYAEVMTFIVVLIGLPVLKMSKFKFSRIQLFIGLLLSILLGYFFLIYFNYQELTLPVGGSWDKVVFGMEQLSMVNFSSSHILRFIRILFFLVMYVILDKFILKDAAKSDEIKKFVVKSGLYIVVICLIEQVTKAMFGSTIFLDLTTKIFGIAESQVVVNFERGGASALQGLTLEPGSLVISFMPAVLILLTSSIYTEKQRFLYLIPFLYVILSSGSFAGFALCVLFVLTYVISNKRRIVPKLFLVFVPAAIATVCLMAIPSFSALFDYYFDRAVSLMNGGNVGSELPRVLSINTAMENFKNHPLLGVGFGSTDVFGFLPTLLASVGSIGTLLWFIVMFKGFESSAIKNIHLFLCMIPFLFFIGSLRMVYSIDVLLLFLLVFRQYKEHKEVTLERPPVLKNVIVAIEGPKPLI